MKYAQAMGQRTDECFVNLKRFDYKDKAKSLGLQWDGNSWMIPEGFDHDFFMSLVDYKT